MRSDLRNDHLSRAAEALRLSGPWRFAALAACLMLLYQFISTAVTYVLSGDLRDFMQGYSAGQRVLAGGWAGLYDLPAQIAFQQQYVARTGAAPGTLDGLPFVSLPPTALLFVPVAMLPPSAAVATWLVLNLALAATAIVITLRAVATPGALGLSAIHRAPPTATMMVGGLLCVLGFVPLVWGLLIGQSVGFTLLLYTLAFLSLARGQDRWGGVSLALLAMIKPQLLVGPLVLLLVQRRWGALAYMAVCGLALGAVSVALIGVDGIASYTQLLGQMDSFFGDTGLGLVTSLMVNWRSWIARIPGIDAQTGMAVTMTLTVATLIVAGYAWRRRASGGRAFARAYLCFTAVGLICSFHSTYQDASILLPIGMAAVGLDRPAVLNTLRSWRSVVGAWWQRFSPAAGPKRVQSAKLSISQWPGLTLLASFLLVVVPGVAWMLLGTHALLRTQLWAAMAAPALLLIIASTLPTQVVDESRIRNLPRQGTNPSDFVGASGKQGPS